MQYGIAHHSEHTLNQRDSCAIPNRPKRQFAISNAARAAAAIGRPKSSADYVRAPRRPTSPPIACMSSLTAITSWGGGTVWQVANAIDLCEGTTNAGQTLDCFNRPITANVDWQSAIHRCQTR